jgi:hypothetical protein
VNIFISILSFSTFFFIYASALNFWGKHILKIAKVTESARPALLFRIVASLSVMVFGSQALFPLVDNNFNLYLTLFFLIGVVGAVLDFSLTSFLPWLKAGKKRIQFWSFVKNRDSLVASLCLSVLMSFIYSIIWPSGQMDGWLFNSGDFYIWIFFAEYFLGGLDLSNLDVLPIFSGLAEDAFGTYMIMGLTSVAFAKPTYLAVSPIVVTFNVWFGTGIYSLSRRIFNLTFFEALAVSSSLILGALFNYVGFTGMFGHLVFLVILVAAITELFPEQGQEYSAAQLTKRLFFPLLLLFLSYQAGYILLIGVLMLTGALLGFFCHSPSSPLIFTQIFRRSLHSLKQIIAPVLIGSVLSAILMPGMAYHLFDRSISAAKQTPGWSLDPINPLLFSGFPFYLSENQIQANFSLETINYSILPYFIFLIFILLILIFLIRQLFSKSNNYKFNHLKFIICIYSVFVVFLSIYILLYSKFGNIYRVWKFSTYLILPLSFIFPSFFIFTFKNFVNKLFFYFLTLSAIFLFIFKFISLYPFIDIPKKYFNAYTNKPYIYNLLLSNNDFNEKNNFIFSLRDVDKTLLTILTLKDSGHKLFFVNGYYFIGYRYFYLDLISDKSIFLSDFESHGPANSTLKSYYHDITGLYAYDFDYINSNGAVAWQAIASPYGPKFIHFLLPQDSIGHDIIVSLTTDMEKDVFKKCAGTIQSLLGGSHEYLWSQNENQSISAIIPASSTETGILTIVLNPSQISEDILANSIINSEIYPNNSNVQTEIWQDNCQFTITSVDLKPFYGK